MLIFTNYEMTVTDKERQGCKQKMTNKPADVAINYNKTRGRQDTSLETPHFTWG